jgi:hypothetical protein
MEAPFDRAALNCPFLRAPLTNGSGTWSAQAYCRLPSGHLRPISRDVLQRVCAHGRFYGCPGYRFWKGSVGVGVPSR